MVENGNPNYSTFRHDMSVKFWVSDVSKHGSVICKDIYLTIRTSNTAAKMAFSVGFSTDGHFGSISCKNSHYPSIGNLKTVGY
jgi:hypothetical protein